MKIWQRIFLAGLLLVTACIHLIGIILTQNQLNDDIGQATDNTAAFQKEIYQSLKYEILYSITNTNAIIVSDQIYMESMEKAVNQSDYPDYGIKLIVSESLNAQNEEYSGEQYDIDLEEEKSKWWIIAHDNGSYTLVYHSQINCYGRELIITTEHNITYIYRHYDSQMRQLQIWSVILSLTAAFVLLFLVQFMLLPLKKLKREMHLIAEGEYGRHLPSRGNTEIDDLARDVNHMSEKIKDNMDQLEQVSENRKIFIGNMAHEMKTPLTSILGFADILSIKPDMEAGEVREYSEIIVKEANRLRDMSGKLMELVHMQEGSIDFKRLEVSELLQNVLQLQFPLLKEKQITVDSNLRRVFINGDRDLLTSLFQNIVDNSRKASPHGGKIVIEVQKNAEKAVIVIRDFGIGMSKEEIHKVQEPFYMVDKSRTRKEGGAGLGLALCAEIIKIHKGEIRIESAENRGCNVFLIFPLGKEKYEKV